MAPLCSHTLLLKRLRVALTYSAGHWIFTWSQAVLKSNQSSAEVLHGFMRDRYTTPPPMLDCNTIYRLLHWVPWSTGLEASSNEVSAISVFSEDPLHRRWCSVSQLV